MSRSARRWRPERIGVLLAVVVVAGGTVDAGLRVGRGVAQSRVEFGGALDVPEILRSFHPRGGRGVADPVPRIERMGSGHLSRARGVVTKPRSGTGTVVLWALRELAPWIVAWLGLVLVVPILRAAGRGDPFRADAARRLTLLGSVLVIGVPADALLRFLVSEIASTGTFASPGVEPEVTFSAGQLLPGVLVLCLAGIFRSGGELRELERSTV